MMTEPWTVFTSHLPMDEDQGKYRDSVRRMKFLRTTTTKLWTERSSDCTRPVSRNVWCEPRPPEWYPHTKSLRSREFSHCARRFMYNSHVMLLWHHRTRSSTCNSVLPGNPIYDESSWDKPKSIYFILLTGAFFSDSRSFYIFQLLLVQSQ